MSKTRVLLALCSGNFDVSKHAWNRMQDRRIQIEDIRNAAQEYVDCIETESDKFEVSGPDLDGQEITVVAVYDGGTLVVTVFGDE